MRAIKLFYVLTGLLFITASQAQITKLFELKQDNDLRYSVRSYLQYDGTWLYGTSYYGGSFDKGAIYKVKPDGSDYSKLADFDGVQKGQYPIAKLILLNDVLFGITEAGGTAGFGVLYSVNPDGTDFKKLYDFTGSGNPKYPVSIITDGVYIYGTTSMGGVSDMGTIFRINPDGSGIKLLREFAGTLDGQAPRELLLSDTLFYGSTSSGGSNNQGTIFRIGKGGTSFLKLYDMNAALTGSGPQAPLALSDTMLYGTTYGGGDNSGGTVFKVSINGNGMTKLYSFTYGSYCTSGLTVYGSVLLGMTKQGGGFSYGNVFSINTNGTNYTSLKVFKQDGVGTLKDGAYPGGNLVLIGDQFFGTTEQGGTDGKGKIFSISSDGSNFSQIMNFGSYLNGSISDNNITYAEGKFYAMTSKGGVNGLGCIFMVDTTGKNYKKLLDFDGNGNGASPKNGKLILDGSTLYGMTYQGGTSNLGCIFKLDTSGADFQKILDFTGTNGQYPRGSLILKDGMLYGVTSQGGANTTGCVFKIGTDGNGYDKILDFGSLAVDGQLPQTLVISGDTLFGATSSGGVYNSGTIFRLQTDNLAYSKLYDLSNPVLTDLIIDDNMLYGIQNVSGGGTVFKISTLGTGYQGWGFSYNNFVQGGGAGQPYLEGNIVYGNGFKINKDMTTGFTTYFSGTSGCMIPLNGRLYGLSSSSLFSIYKLPSVQVSNMNITNLTSTGSGTIKWDNGDGANRIVFMRQGAFSKITSSPDGMNLYPSTDWNSPGTALDSWNCIYQGNGDSVNVINLVPNKSYTVVAMEGNGSKPYNIYITDTLHHNPVSFTSLKWKPYINWEEPYDIYYGTAINNSTLYATVWMDISMSVSVSGTKTFDPPSGTILNPGMHQPLHVLFTPNSSSTYDTVSKTVYINVLQYNPDITWSNPADINYGTLLDANQLNAQGNYGGGMVNGTYIYDPPAGTKLEVGNGQELKVTFIPDDLQYDTAYASVFINVLPATGVSDIGQGKNFAYPSPFSDYLEINASKEARYAGIYDLTGRLIMEEEIQGTKTRILTSGVNHGSYILIISDQQRRKISMMKIQK